MFSIVGCMVAASEHGISMLQHKAQYSYAKTEAVDKVLHIKPHN